MRSAAWLGIALTGVVLGMSLPPAASAADVLIATGSTRSVYFEIGRAICRIVNRQAQGLACSPLATDGSRFNIANVRSGAYEFGLVQSDDHFHAVNGSGPFAYVDESYANVRSVMSVHAEPFTVMARRDSGIRRFEDLQGKRVNIGSPGSVQRQVMEAAMAAMGWTSATFALAEELPADQQSLALCHGRVEAMVYVVSHPNPSVEQSATLCDTALLGVGGETIERLLEEHPYFAAVEIPAGIYHGMSDPVHTFGMRATLVTSADMSAEMVYALVAALGDNLDSLQRMHPGLGALEPGTMVAEGLFAPLHEGAARYYRERGWAQ